MGDGGRTAAGALVRKMLARLAEATADPPGVTRDAYGPGEAAAHAIAADEARALGAEVAQDAAGNLYMTLPGTDRGAPVLLTGSHLDSVPHGGNYDGAAGVAAGLAAMAALRAAGTVPPQDLTVVAFRAEEAAWFPLSYPGAAAALGRLAPAALAARRADTGRTLADHMAAARNVAIDLGPRFDWAAATSDPVLVAALSEAARALGIGHVLMPSGAGHDSAELAAAGVPVAMIFVRNANGSHNPDEAMEAADLDAAVGLLARVAALPLPQRGTAG